MKHILYLILAFTFILFSCNKNESEINPIVKDIEEFVFAPGELEWNNQFNLIAQTDGVISELTFKEGVLVSKNQLLGYINNPSSINNSISTQQQLDIAENNLSINSPQLKQIENNILFAEIKYQQDKNQAERYQRLFNSESVAKAELENIQLAAKNSLTQLESLKNEYKQVKSAAKSQQINAKNSLSNNKIIAGYNKISATEKGTIIKKYKETGDYIRKGEIIALIGNKSEIKATLNIDENSMGKIKIGQPVFIQLNTNKDKMYKGKINEILPSFDTQTQSFICKITFDNLLVFSLSGTQLEANILVGSKKNALLIPRNYLGFGNKVIIKGKENPVVIKTGIISSDWVEILSGLTKEDVVIEPK